MNNTLWSFAPLPRSARPPAGLTISHDLSELTSNLMSGAQAAPLVLYPMPWDNIWCVDEIQQEEWLAFYTEVVALSNKFKAKIKLQPVDEWLVTCCGQHYKSMRYAPDSLAAYCLIRLGDPMVEVLKALEKRAALQLRDPFKGADWQDFSPRHFRQVRSLVGQQRKLETMTRHNRELHAQIGSMRYELDRREDEALVLKKQLEAIRLEANLTTQAVQRLVAEFRTLLVSGQKEEKKA